MEEERRVGDDARFRRASEACGQELLQVDLGLTGLGNREGVLHAAALRRDGALRLALGRHLHAVAALHLRGQRPQIEPGSGVAGTPFLRHFFCALAP